MGCKEHDGPGGIVAEESAKLTMTFGSSSTTSDCRVDALATQGDAVEAHAKAATSRRPIKGE